MRLFFPIIIAPNTRITEPDSSPGCYGIQPTSWPPRTRLLVSLMGVGGKDAHQRAGRGRLLLSCALRAVFLRLCVKFKCSDAADVSHWMRWCHPPTFSLLSLFFVLFFVYHFCLCVIVFCCLFLCYIWFPYFLLLPCVFIFFLLVIRKEDFIICCFPFPSSVLSFLLASFPPSVILITSFLLPFFLICCDWSARRPSAHDVMKMSFSSLSLWRFDGINVQINSVQLYVSFFGGKLEMTSWQRCFCFTRVSFT